MIELKVLTPDDWPLWRELRLAALAEAPYAFGSKLADWQGEGDLEQRWRDRLSIPGSHNLIALRDGQPIGMCSGVPGATSAAADLISMWVSPAARGLGVAGALIDAVAAWAGAQGAETLYLTVFADNEAARKLYARHGFADTGRLIEDDPGRAPELILAKPLPAPAGHGSR